MDQTKSFIIRFTRSILVILLCCFSDVCFGQMTALLPEIKHDFIVIAHRGSHILKGENTIAAINEAIQLGADYVEVDLRTTKDGRLVLCHDEKVDRVSKGLIKDLNWAEISTLNILGNDKKAYRIPEFKDVLKACKGKINIYLDFKDADVGLVYEQIKNAGMEHHVLVYPNNEDQYFSWRKIAPNIPQILSLPNFVKTREDLLRLLANMQIDVVDSVNDSVLLATLLENKVAVFLDVQSGDEGPVHWEKAIRSGVQGVQTDHPQALIDYLNKNNLRNRKVETTTPSE